LYRPQIYHRRTLSATSVLWSRRSVSNVRNGRFRLKSWKLTPHVLAIGDALAGQHNEGSHCAQVRLPLYKVRWSLSFSRAIERIRCRRLTSVTQDDSRDIGTTVVNGSLTVNLAKRYKGLACPRVSARRSRVKVCEL
jgi:hypothetical protein